MKTHNDTEGMEERFDKQFPDMIMNGNEAGGYDCRVYIKNFISQEIKRSNHALLDRVLEKKTIGEYEYQKGADWHVDRMVSVEDIEEIRKGLG